LNGTTVYYTNNAYPDVSTGELHTINYYDDYAFDLDGGVSETSYDITPIVNAKSLPTGSKVRVLDPSTGSGQAWTTTVTYYDEKSRPVYVYSHNPYIDAADKVKSRFDFIGKVLETTAVHTKNGQTTTVIEKFYYDHADRLVDQTHQINSGPAERMARNTYDQLGQLVKKDVGGQAGLPALQNVDYTYNIRGWLKAINDVNNIGTIDLFAFKLGYNEGTTPLYNGNISLTQWKTRNTDSSLKTYNYTYDALNRITSAINTNANYNLDLVNYDKNGNIMALKRKGHTNAAATTFGMMDDLTYSYDAGNKLTKVEDIASLEGFKNGANITTEYTYDQNGNMVTDANKGITGIVYNHLNLPTQVTIAGQNISYIYDAVGTKLRKTVSGITTDYAGNYVYENSTLQFFNTAEGYVEPNGTGWQYVYQYKDHLGNVRLSYADSNGDGLISPSSGGGQGEAEIREENNFYPFGLKHKGYNFVVNGRDHKYGFGNKEEQDELGLGWIDITARNYDPALGRWMNLDPLAEAMRRHSPYNYAFDNPVYFIDPDGNFPTFGLGPTQYYNSYGPAGGNTQQNRSGGWKATLNENGSTSYVAEKGATKESFGSQYNLKPNIVDKIFELMGIQKVEGGKTEVSGQAVRDVTGNEVLKLKDFSDKQRNLEHLAFAFRHDKSKDNIFKITDYFYADENTPTSLTVDFNGVLNINGESIGVWGEFRLISERNASALGCRGDCYQAPYAYRSKDNLTDETEGIVNGRIVKNDVYRVDTFIYIDGKHGNERGYKKNYYSILVTKRGFGVKLKNYLEN